MLTPLTPGKQILADTELSIQADRALHAAGVAYLSAQKGKQAAAEFAKIVKNQGVDPISPYYPLAHVGLARAYALQSDKANSRREYEEFFTRWKDADRDIPLLREAETEYARLK